MKWYVAPFCLAASCSLFQPAPRSSVSPGRAQEQRQAVSEDQDLQPQEESPG